MINVTEKSINCVYITQKNHSDFLLKKKSYTLHMIAHYYPTKLPNCTIYCISFKKSSDVAYAPKTQALTWRHKKILELQKLPSYANLTHVYLH